ncbi:hypothetical protein [Jatrophihabitans sp. GAS493]|uniref:hypothetical protein n=1 Tax=Jatrophihabitans sp. GAS493 TaxID=1907575 RepID=UPI0012FD5FBD|nr:hypothetical protein [Jatrophihabitans sp. GAS493]
MPATRSTARAAPATSSTVTNMEAATNLGAAGANPVQGASDAAPAPAYRQSWNEVFQP